MEGAREKLIAIIEEARRESNGTIGSMNGGFAAWYADKLLAAGVAPVQGWIPVSEHKPEHDDVVIAFFPEMRGTECAIQIQKGWSVKLKFCYHRMPLPEDPKEYRDAES